MQTKAIIQPRVTQSIVQPALVALVTGDAYVLSYVLMLPVTLERIVTVRAIYESIGEQNSDKKWESGTRNRYWTDAARSRSVPPTMSTVTRTFTDTPV